MKYKKSIPSMIFDTFNYMFMIFVIFVMVYPFIHVLAVSFSESAPVGMGHVSWFPKGFDLKSYELVFTSNAVALAYKNTIIYTVVGTILVLIASSMCAYPLSKKRFYGRNFISFFLALTMIFPGGMIPKFLLISGLGLLDTRASVILISVCNVWYIVLVRTNFQSIPESISESAYIDGANDWRILFQIILPLSKPILATVGLFAAVSYWNSFFHALIFLNDPKKYPLQLILRKIITSNIEDLGISDQLSSRGNPAEGLGLIERVKAATIIVTVGPILLVYPFAQKYFIKGALVGSVKA